MMPIKIAILSVTSSHFLKRAFMGEPLSLSLLEGDRANSLRRSGGEPFA